MSKGCCGKGNSKKQLSTPSLIVNKIEENKVVLLGRSGVGKSSIVHRLIKDEFEEKLDLTLGAFFVPTSITLAEGISIVLNIWDTAGTERYESLMHLYYRQSSAAILVYDVNDPTSFETSTRWALKLEEEEPNCLLYLVGNKYDNEQTEISENFKEQIARFAKEHCMKSLFISAKQGINVKSIFEDIAQTLYDRTSEI